jgi:hypothetical protein
MRRRDFIATLGFATVSPWARDARAQSGRSGRRGFGLDSIKIERRLVDKVVGQKKDAAKVVRAAKRPIYADLTRS